MIPLHFSGLASFRIGIVTLQSLSLLHFSSKFTHFPAFWFNVVNFLNGMKTLFDKNRIKYIRTRPGIELTKLIIITQRILILVKTQTTCHINNRISITLIISIVRSHKIKSLIYLEFKNVPQTSPILVLMISKGLQSFFRHLY